MRRVVRMGLANLEAFYEGGLYYKSVSAKNDHHERSGQSERFARENVSNWSGAGMNASRRKSGYIFEMDPKLGGEGSNL